MTLLFPCLNHFKEMQKRNKVAHCLTISKEDVCKILTADIDIARPYDGAPR